MATIATHHRPARTSTSGAAPSSSTPRSRHVPAPRVGSALMHAVGTARDLAQAGLMASSLEHPDDLGVLSTSCAQARRLVAPAEATVARSRSPR